MKCFYVVLRSKEDVLLIIKTQEKNRKKGSVQFFATFRSKSCELNEIGFNLLQDEAQAYF